MKTLWKGKEALLLLLRHRSGIRTKGFRKPSVYFTLCYIPNLLPRKKKKIFHIATSIFPIYFRSLCYHLDGPFHSVPNLLPIVGFTQFQPVIFHRVTLLLLFCSQSCLQATSTAKKGFGRIMYPLSLLLYFTITNDRL